MAKGEASSPRRRIRPALTPDARENQLVSLAVDLAEKQLMEGTASSQVLTHYLKLATSKYRLENIKLERENELLKAKTESLESARNIESMYKEAMAAFRSYQGAEVVDDDQDI